MVEISREGASMTSPSRFNMQAIKSAGAALAAQDRVHEEKFDRERKELVRVRLENIKPRAHKDTRVPQKEEVEALAETIEAVGLIQPPAVDLHHRLIAGGHRKAALEYLRDNKPEAFKAHFPDGLVPVFVLPIDAQLDPDAARAAEIGENRWRKNYSHEEVLALIAEFTAAGYAVTRGRPKPGDRQKALGPALEAALGLSERQVRRIIKEANAPLGALEKKEASGAGGTATGPNVDRSMKSLGKALEAFLSNTSSLRRADVSAFRDKVKELQTRLEKLQAARDDG
jgi:ParB family chromosome partitioning protein